MAVIDARGNNSTFGGLGSFATALGTLTGQPWLSAIGMGMNAVDSMSAGGSGGSGGGMGNIDQMLDYMKQAGWINPASGSIANTAAQNAVQNYEDLKKKWGALDYGGFNVPGGY